VCTCKVSYAMLGSRRRAQVRVYALIYDLSILEYHVSKDTTHTQ
jgi:hypothetical protein